MPAPVVLVHDDPEFVSCGAAALRDMGYDVAAFADPLAALTSLEAAKSVEILITRVVYAPGLPNGVALARMARLRKPGIRSLFMALPEFQEHVPDWGHLLPLPATTVELVAAVAKVLAGPD